MIGKGKWPLFEKSGAKTFLGSGHAGGKAIGLKEQSFFATFCSQKVALSLSFP
jgi:hypothetical protein